MTRGWWSGKTGRVAAYLGCRVALAERAVVVGALPPAQRLLFDAMHPADQAHGLAVRADLAGRGITDPDLLVAALLHDAGKGPETGLMPRIAWALAERYGAPIAVIAAGTPGLRAGIARLRDHEARSAELAAAAGCSARTVRLIAGDADRADDGLRLLRLADDAHG